MQNSYYYFNFPLSCIVTTLLTQFPIQRIHMLIENLTKVQDFKFNHPSVSVFLVPPPKLLDLISHEFCTIFFVFLSVLQMVLIFSDIKVSLKVQFHNGLEPISDHAATKRGDNFSFPVLLYWY